MQLEKMTDPNERQSLIERIAEIAEHKLVDQVRAFQWWCKAISEAPTSERAAELPDVKGRDAKKFVELIQLFELKTATVQGGAQRDDAAVLFVKGTGFDASPNAGRVILQREAGVWKVAKVIVKSPL